MGLGTIVTVEMVREIISTSLSDSDIEGAIASAMVMYRNYLGSQTLDNDLQLEIKRYLSAHFVFLRQETSDVYITEEKIGDASVRYAKAESNSSSSDIGLLSTKWGKTAIAFDPTGTLMKIGKSAVKMIALTTPSSESLWGWT